MTTANSMMLASQIGIIKSIRRDQEH